MVMLRLRWDEVVSGWIRGVEILIDIEEQTDPFRGQI
jgi:hypothetical protein